MHRIGRKGLLMIGTIKSNESPEAILLKKDAELNLNETDFPFYIDFCQMLEPDFLYELSEKFLHINWNETKLFDNVEMKYDQDGNLYFEWNIGEI